MKSNYLIGSVSNPDLCAYSRFPEFISRTAQYRINGVFFGSLYIPSAVYTQLLLAKGNSMPITRHKSIASHHELSHDFIITGKFNKTEIKINVGLEK